uniref:RIKEN cDNA 1700003E16 gene n=1 Tax=Jaculus jaculus TaxID=51337 RepID=A0A8C5L0G1_JACJA
WRQARDRGVTRSKVEKARPTTQPQVPQVDIVPGRLNEAEWIALMALEEGEDVVGDILAEFLARVMDCVFEVYLTRQCVPFTISQAQEAMLQITEWRFLARDEGETAVAEDPTWGEDEEPLACTTDAWAQGSVPVLHAPASVGLEERFQHEVSPALILLRSLSELRPYDHGNADQLPVETSCLDRGSQEQTEPSDFSAEPIVTPGPPPTLGVSEEAVPQDDLPACKDSSLENLPYSVRQPDAARDRAKRQTPGMPRAASTGSASQRRGGSSRFRSDASFQRPASLAVPPGRSTTIARLDPARLPRHWVRPLVEVLVPDPGARLLQTYRLGERTQECQETQTPELQALQPRADPKLGDSPAEFQPPGPCVPFPALGSGPALGLRLSSSLGYKPPFLTKRPVPPEVEYSPSPKLWPGAKWPSGCEGEAELLGEVWAHRTRLLPQGMEPAEKEDTEDSEWPQMVPQFLEATSQVLWKPLIPLEVMQLAPGVSMWKPGTQELLTSTVTQEAKAGGTSCHAEEQLPIQTDVTKPQATMTHLLKKETPKAWLLPAKPVPHSGS